MVIGILLVPAGIGILLVPASGIVGRKMPQVPASVVGRNDAQGYRKNDAPVAACTAVGRRMFLVPANVVRTNRCSWSQQV